MNNEMKQGTAIVIGGSMAGLLTARVVSDYYGQVLVVEKDELPERPAERSGVPHAYHPHRFTDRGKSITARLFPGYEDDLVGLGAPSSQNKTVHFMNQYGSMTAQYPRNDVKFSRAVLEWVIRTRVTSIPNVSFLPKHDVIRLVTGPDRTDVAGIVVRDRDDAGREKSIAADLVIDASGRNSKLAKWLVEMGYDVPAPDLLKADIGYSTRRYKLPAHMKHVAEQRDVINIAGQPANGTFTGVFSFIENEVAELLLYRPGGHYPPTDAEQFEQAVAGLPSPIIGDIVKELEPIGAPRGFRVPALYRQRYERMNRWPSGLLVIGDAYCIYDPIFGQGMTVAAIEAELLDACLREQRECPKPDFERRVLQRMQSAIEPAWWLNCANDLQWEGVEYEGAELPKGIDFGKTYLDLFLRHATINGDWQLYGLYWAVSSLALPPNQMIGPQIAAEVLSGSEEGNKLLAELAERHGGRPLSDILELTLPDFAGLGAASPAAAS